MRAWKTVSQQLDSPATTVITSTTYQPCVSEVRPGNLSSANQLEILPSFARQPQPSEQLKVRIIDKMDSRPSTSSDDNRSRNAQASSSPSPRWDRNVFENPAVRRTESTTIGTRSLVTVEERHSQEAGHKIQDRGEAQAASGEGATKSRPEVAVEYLRPVRAQLRRIYLTLDDADQELFDMVHSYRNLVIRTLVMHQLSKSFEPSKVRKLNFSGYEVGLPTSRIQVGHPLGLGEQRGMVCYVCNHAAVNSLWCSLCETMYCEECCKLIIKVESPRPDLLNASIEYVHPEKVICLLSACNRRALEYPPSAVRRTFDMRAKCDICELAIRADILDRHIRNHCKVTRTFEIDEEDIPSTFTTTYIKLKESYETAVQIKRTQLGKLEVIPGLPNYKERPEPIVFSPIPRSTSEPQAGPSTRYRPELSSEEEDEDDYYMGGNYIEPEPEENPFARVRRDEVNYIPELTVPYKEHPEGRRVPDGDIAVYRALGASNQATDLKAFSFANNAEMYIGTPPPLLPRAPIDGLTEQQIANRERNRVRARQNRARKSQLQIQKREACRPKANPNLAPSPAYKLRIIEEDKRAAVKIPTPDEMIEQTGVTQVTLTDAHIVSFDCEMCTIHTTKQGAAIKKQVAIWVSLVDKRGRVILDKMIRHPERSVFDYGTRFHGLTAWHVSRARSINCVRKAVLAEFVKADVIIGYNLTSDLSALLINRADQEILIHKFRDMATYYSPYLEISKHLRLNITVLIHLGILCQEKGKVHNPVDDARVTLWLYRKERTRIEKTYLKTFQDYYLAIRGRAEAAYLIPVIPPHTATKKILETYVENGTPIPKAIQKDSKESFSNYLAETAEAMSREDFSEYVKEFGAISTDIADELKDWWNRSRTSGDAKCRRTDFQPHRLHHH